jgi:hypothetical protein
MLKTIVAIAFFFFTFSKFAEANFKKFDIVEIKQEKKEKSEGKNPEYLKKNKNKKTYGIVFSGDEYNKNSKAVIVAPVVLSEKDYKGRYVFPFKASGKSYVIFTDKLRVVKNDKILKSDLNLNLKEKEKVKELFNNLSK